MADQSGFVHFPDLCVETLHVNMSRGFTQKGLVTLALHPLAHQLANATSRFRGFAGAALGRFSYARRFFISRNTPSRCSFFFRTRSAWSTLLSRTVTYTANLSLSRRCLTAQACRLEPCAANSRKTGTSAAGTGV